MFGQKLSVYLFIAASFIASALAMKALKVRSDLTFVQRVNIN